MRREESKGRGGEVFRWHVVARRDINFVLARGMVLTLGALATGCDGKSNPATPSQPAAATVTGLAISGIDAVLTDVSMRK